MTYILGLFQGLIADVDASGHLVFPRLLGDETFMACVLGGITDGIGLYLCFANNGSTGGTDIIAAIVNKYKQMSLGTVILACDIIIISSCYPVFHDWFRVIFGFVLLFICSFTLDFCLNKTNQSVQFLIFSRNPQKIADAIVKTGRGVTMLDGEGWYTHSERKVLLSIVRKNEQMYIQRLIKSIDPFAFVSLSNANSVWGEGFDQMKVKAEKQQKGKRTLVFATNSTHKLNEARAILGEKYDVRSLADIGCRRLSLDVRIRGQNDLADIVVGKTGQQFLHVKLLGTDLVHGRDDAPEHVVEAVVRTRALDGAHVTRLGHDADDAAVA